MPPRQHSRSANPTNRVVGYFSHDSNPPRRDRNYNQTPRIINNQQATQRHASSSASPPPKQLDIVPHRELKFFIKAHNLDKSLYEAMKDYNLSNEVFETLSNCTQHMPKSAVTSPNILTLCKVVPHIMDSHIYDADTLMQALSSVKVQPAELAAQALLRQIKNSTLDQALKVFIKMHNLDESLLDWVKQFKFSDDMSNKLAMCAVHMPKSTVTIPNILTLCEVVPHIMDLPIYDADMLMQALSSVKIQPAELAAQALLRQISKSSSSVRVLDQAKLCQSVQNALLELTNDLCPLLSNPQLETIGSALDNLLLPLFTHIKDTDKSPVAVVDYLSTHHGLVLNLDQEIIWAGRALSDFSQGGGSTLVLNDWPDADRLPNENTLSIQPFSASTLVLPVGNAILLAALFHTMITNRVTTDDDVSRLFAVLGWTDADRARLLCSDAFTIVSSLQGQSTFDFITEYTPSLTISGPPGTGKSQLYLILFSLLVNAKIDVTLVNPSDEFLHRYIRVANGTLTFHTNKLLTFPLHNNIVLFDVHDEQYKEHAPFIEGLLSSRQVGLVVALRSSQVTAAPKQNSGLKNPYCPISLSLPCYPSRFNIMHLYAQQMYALQSPDNDPNSDTVIQQATALVKKVIRAYMSRFGNSLFYIDSTSTQSCKNALGTDLYSIQPFPDSLTHAETQLLASMLYCNPTIRISQAFFAPGQPPRSPSAIAKMRHVIVARSDGIRNQLPFRHVLYPPMMLHQERRRLLDQILLNGGLAVWLPRYNVQVSECFVILNGEELDPSLFPDQPLPRSSSTIQTKLPETSSITTHAVQLLEPTSGVSLISASFTALITSYPFRKAIIWEHKTVMVLPGKNFPVADILFFIPQQQSTIVKVFPMNTKTTGNNTDSAHIQKMGKKLNVLKNKSSIEAINELDFQFDPLRYYKTDKNMHPQHATALLVVPPSDVLPPTSPDSL